jgi:Leucine Rich Repeat (LRR) protein
MIRFRISLKWLLLATAAISVLLGTVGKRLYDDWQRRQLLIREQRIAERLEGSGGGALMRDAYIVEADMGSQLGGAKATSLLKVASSLEKIRSSCALDDNDVSLLARHEKLRRLSIPYFSPGMSDRSLRVIGGLHELQVLSLAPGLITDDGLAFLGELTELTGLDLWSCPIQGRGLIHIARLPKLQSLSLRGSKIDDDGLSALSECASLSRLELDDTRITGTGLAHLAALPKLQKVNLARTRLTNGVGLAQLDQVAEIELSAAQILPGILTHLAGMKSLRSVSLLRSDITDDALEDLKDAQQIEKLVLSQSNVSDAGLVHLENLKSLKLLHLGQTHVTAAGARRLSDMLPNTSIIYPGGSFGPELDRDEPPAQ